MAAIQKDIEQLLVAGANSSPSTEACLQRVVRYTGGGEGSPAARRQVADAAAALLSVLAGEARNAPRWKGSSGESRVTLLLRVLRNCCAEASAAAVLLAHGLLSQVAEVVTALVSTVESAQYAVELDTAAQLLANFAASGGVEARVSLWESLLVPCAAFARLATVVRQRTQAPLCHCLYICCRDDSQRSVELFSEQAWQSEGRPLLCYLLDAHAMGEGGGEDLARLLGLLSYRQGLLEKAVPAMRSFTVPLAVQSSAGMAEEGEDGDGCQPEPCNTYDLLLLLTLSEWPQCCATCLSSEEAGDMEREDVTQRSGCERSLRFLMDSIRRHAQDVAASERSGDSSRACMQAERSLRMGLQLLRSLTGTDGPPDEHGRWSNRITVQMLGKVGMVELLLSLLKALPPIKPARAATSRAASEAPRMQEKATIEEEEEEEKELIVLDPSAELTSAAHQFPRTLIFRGYRTLLVAVLGNAAHNAPTIQQKIVDLGGVELLLAQAQIEERSPWVREWALWAVRNLTEGSVAAHQAIRELEVCQTLDSPELQAMGKQVEYDPATGKMKLVDRQQSAQ